MFKSREDNFANSFPAKPLILVSSKYNQKHWKRKFRLPLNTSNPGLSSYYRGWHTGHLKLQLTILVALETSQPGMHMQNLPSQEQNINMSLYETYLNKPDKSILSFKKEDWKLLFQAIREQQFVEFAKMLPYDWLRNYFSIYFVRQTTYRNYRFLLNAWR